MSRSRFARVGGVALVLLAVGASVCFGAAKVGGKAPALRIATWIKGSPVNLADGIGKTVYVVEFWATWCAPCKDTIPHLSDLQKRLADKGVVVIGITDESAATVKEWLAREKTIRMDYTVARDDRRRTASAFRGREGSIPHAYVVDKKGIVVWHGHPMAGLDQVVEGVLAGTFDPKRHARKQQLQQQAIGALRGGDAARGLTLIDEFIAADPEDPLSYQFKLHVLTLLRRPTEAQALREQMATKFANNARVLNDLAMHYAAADDLSRRDPQRALALAGRAVELTQAKDAMTLDTLARAYYAVCNIDKAIETQMKAVAADGGPGKTQTRAVLEYYRTVKKIAATPPPTPS